MILTALKKDNIKISVHLDFINICLNLIFPHPLELNQNTIKHSVTVENP